MVCFIGELGDPIYTTRKKHSPLMRCTVVNRLIFLMGKKRSEVMSNRFDHPCRKLLLSVFVSLMALTQRSRSFYLHSFLPNL